MEFLEGLGKQISEITPYDVKTYYTQAKNAIMNYTEWEAKVREATNDEPWGTSTTMMQEIANATYTFQQCNEIMSTIYKRFTEKEAREWRQIYKALQLLEYLVKNGSERVVDDARSHSSIIKILRNFHYIDEKGKDQGLNVRNRASEIADLLGDVDKIRAERKKSRALRSKFVGFESQSSSLYSHHSMSAGSSRHYEENNWRDHGLREAGHSYNGSQREDDFDEYDAGTYEDRSPAANTPVIPSASTEIKPSHKNKPTPAKPEVNLFDIDDELDNLPATSTVLSAPAKVPMVNIDDEFDDFQSATPAAPSTTNTVAKSNVFDLLEASKSSQQTPSPNPSMNSMNFFSGPPVVTQASIPTTPSPNNKNMGSMQAMKGSGTPMVGGQQPFSSATSAKPKANAFDDIWALAGGSSSSTKKTELGTGTQSMSSMAQENFWKAAGTSNQKSAETGNSSGANGGAFNMGSMEDSLI